MTTPRPPVAPLRRWLAHALDAVASTRRRVVVAVAVVIGLASAVVGIAAGTSEPSAGASEVFLEAAGDAGPAPFVVLLRPPATVLRLDPDSEEGGLGALVGTEAGLYGGSLREGVCDKATMVAFLRDNPQKAAAWAEVQGIAPADLPGYLERLTALQLRVDTRVTNHGFSDGRATPRQAVLEAGTAVLVDAHGVPRAKCTCGNPLLPPTAVDDVAYVGDRWEGFEEGELHRIVAGPQVSAFEVYDSATGRTFLRPVGTDGERDQPVTGGSTTAPRVPVVRGLSAVEAEQLLAARHYVVTVEREASDVVPAGRAVRTNPPGDSPLGPGARVTLYLSSGPAEAKVAVPVVAGLPRAEAARRLEAAGLRVDVREEPSATVPEGVVLASEPAAGAPASAGSAVVLVVSSGPVPVDVGGISTSTVPSRTSGTSGTGGAPGPGGAAVPDVRGRSEADAAATLAAAGLGATVVARDDPAPVGSVVAQDPPPGRTVPPGTAVTLGVSRGLVVPDLAGLTADQARDRLAGVGFAAALSSEPSGSVPAGAVLRQSPAPGARAAGGSPVAVVVSSGPAPVVVPDVAGRPRAEAEKLVDAAGLRVGRVLEAPSSAAPGTVVAQDPAAGQPVAPGTVVTLTVAVPVPVAPPVVNRFAMGVPAGGCPNGTMTLSAAWDVTGASTVEVRDLTTNTVVARGGASGRADVVHVCFDANQAFPSRTYQLVAHATADASVTSTAEQTVTSPHQP